jgi:TM2 domain-containing membrane protein YozV
MSCNCPNCGTAAAPGANFCPRCGCHFATGARPQASAPPQTGGPARTDFPPQPGYPLQPGYPPQAGYPYPQPYQPYPALPNTGKDKIAAGLMAILLGSLGIHLFYLGKTGWGLVFLLGTLFTCGMAAVITGTIGLVQGIMYLCANDYDFQQKYAIEKRFF